MTLLRLLVSHAGKVLTHKFILNQVWGAESRRAISAHLRPHPAPEAGSRPPATGPDPDRTRRGLPSTRVRLTPASDQKPGMSALGQKRTVDLDEPYVGFAPKAAAAALFSSEGVKLHKARLSKDALRAKISH